MKASRQAISPSRYLNLMMKSFSPSPPSSHHFEVVVLQSAPRDVERSCAHRPRQFKTEVVHCRGALEVLGQQTPPAHRLTQDMGYAQEESEYRRRDEIV